MNNNITGTIVQLNEYPPDKFNVLIPVTTMQVMSNLQRIIVNKVQLDVADPENSKDIYREKSSGKYAITKVGGMKLAAAANISIVETESGMTDGCKRCVDMARAVGKPKACGTCPARYDVAVTVTIRVPEPSGGFRLMKAASDGDGRKQGIHAGAPRSPRSRGDLLPPGASQALHHRTRRPQSRRPGNQGGCRLQLLAVDGDAV